MAGMGTTSRRKYITDFVTNNGSADVAQLSNDLGVSEMTIRRDLDKLEEEKKILRVHGGAVPAPSSSFELPLNNRLDLSREEKDAIGRYAASLVSEGDVIALDASTTALMVADHLQVPVTVVTNNMEIALRLIANPLAEVVMLGGHLRKRSASMVGFEMTRMMESYRVDKLFFSAKAASITHGISDATVEEGEAKKAMIAAAQQCFLMLDHTKLGTNAFYRVADLDKNFEIITDSLDSYSDVQIQFLHQCRESGISIHSV